MIRFHTPLVFDNCDISIEVNLVGYQVNNTNVCNGVWITRNWTAKDDHGNQGYCSEALHISPNGPVDFPKDTTWTCTVYDLYPNITNPTAFTDSLHTTGSGRPYGVGGPYCQYNYQHSDDTLQVCGSSFKIIRTWTVIDWCTGVVILEDFEGDSNQQLIKVMDYNKPSITVPTITLNANVQGAYPNPCASTGLLPAPVVFDSCNDVTVRIFTAVGEAIYVNGVDGKQGGYVPAPGLKIGAHIVTYKVTDACGNFTEVNLVATVVDQIAPVAICIEFTDVNLEANGFTEVPADAFNLASHDNCCLDYFLVKRMGEPNANFAPSIDFSCEDVPEVMVVLRVVDCFGNYNECMVTAHVNDKNAPICIAPQQKTIPCTEMPADVTQAWLDGFGTATFYDNCDATIVELPYAENINACGEGHVTRYWKVVDSYGNQSGTCEQHIYVVPKSDWLLKFPADFYGSCDDIVDADELEVVNFGCDLFAVNHEDQYFALTLGDSACYKIVRTWKVINWCSYDPYAPFQTINHHPLGVWVDEDDYNNYGSYQYQQIIKIYDDTPPVLSFPFSNIYCSVDATCTVGDVYLPIQIDGVCSNAFNVVYHLDLYDDLSYDLNGTGFFNGQLPMGKHRIVYIVEDGCNNEAQLTVNFEVKDCKNPTAVCENGLTVELMQTGMVPVCADALDYGSYDNCPGDLHISFSQDINDTCRIFTCLDFGVNPVNIWVTDAAGNQDFCTTFINVQDNMFSCSTGAPVSGLIATGENEPVEGVSVMLNNNNSGTLDFMTGSDGMYQFPGLTIGEDYTVTPLKDDEPLNGVTTFDLVLMSKHILGVSLLTSPYQLIAADANKSNSVTTFDLVEVRKLILMINMDFPNNTSWRFVEKSYQFPNPANPWLAVFPEVTNINNLPAAQSGMDFVAIKIGDVNGSAVANGLTGEETGNRSAGTLSFVMDNTAFQTGTTVPVTFKAKDFNTVYGFQFTIDFSLELLDFQSVVQTSVTSAGNFGTTLTDEGAVTVSWETNPPLTLVDGEPVITLNFMAKADGSLSEAIGISSRFTAAEAYVGEPAELFDVALIVNNPSATAASLRPAYELFQNIPNPFSKKTVIGFQLPNASDATLTVFDATGRKITVITRDFYAGYNEIELDRTTLPSTGLVFYRLEAGSFTATRSMTIMR
ncbi:MAG: T9SS type A sorting domain-containing protein [Saprospiraceae bacterium]|nr:T9SS type A sorting domain-containing protein [Saprospiraceae bacterium]